VYSAAEDLFGAIQTMKIVNCRFHMTDPLGISPIVCGMP
jgi:hypothetical protein